MDFSNTLDVVGNAVNAAMEGINRGLVRLFGNSNEREVRKLQPKIAAINALEESMAALSDSDLRGQTEKLRRRLAAGETLDDILVEAFATCREAGKRYLKMRHYDVQLLGGMVLHSGRIAEMVTGEGKTLVATLPSYLNALEGKGVHVVTVNDYLARRDAEWNQPLFAALGLSVGAIQSTQDPDQRKHHYNCDITYGTNNEFGFDYLRDNMKPTRELQCQRFLNYAIIDEVDSILIDEARTPLIIAGPANDDPDKYRKANLVAKQLKRELHFEVKEKEHTCHLTDAGVHEAERLVGVESFYTAGNMEWPHLIDNALKALHLYRRDKDYVVISGEVVIIDEHTGRKMEGRRWSDGLHQSVEAKENVAIKEETQTLATITLQNYFKLYRKLSGMTGTAMTEAQEFYKIYKLDVVAIPTNRKLQRVNYPDVIFMSQKEKWKAVIDEVRLVHKTGRPVLIGTTSVEKSEMLSDLLKRSGIRHEVLNAKFVEREAEIVAQAGRKGAVTVSTNMAGRGTDIILGGNPEIQAWALLKNEYPTRLEVPPEVWRSTIEPFEGPMKVEGRLVASPPSTEELVKAAGLRDHNLVPKYVAALDQSTESERNEAKTLAEKHGLDAQLMQEMCDLYRAARPGGLHIIGTERHDSRRIDNQLRGRAGRQGDPGSGRFFLSLEDDLMRIFMGDWVRGMLSRMGMRDGEAIESPMVTRRIEAAQKKVEERHFENRKHLLEYDEIMDTQRKRVYGFRQAILDGADTRELMLQMIDHEIDRAAQNYLDPMYGAKAFATFASNRLRVELDPRDFYRADFANAVDRAKEEALRFAESTILDKINEDLDPEIPEKEWNWEAFTNWANFQFDAKLKSYDLKRMGRDKIDQYLYEIGKKAIDETNLSAGADCFDEDFAVMNFLAWASQKLATPITREDLGDAVNDASTIKAKLKEKARSLYDAKEISFPVLCGLNRYMADKSQSPDARYDRESLVNWAQSRFNAPLDLEDFRSLTRSESMQRLIAHSERFYDRRYIEKINRKLDEIFGNEKATKMRPVEQLESLVSWARTEYRAEISFSTPFVSRDQAQLALVEAAQAYLRPEIHEVERQLLLQFLDTGWKDHLYGMDYLKSGIGLVGYAQVDPKVEYKRKGKQLFEEMWDTVERRVTEIFFRVEEVDPNFVASIFNVTSASHQAYQPSYEGATQQPASPVMEAGSPIRRQQEAAVASGQQAAPMEPIRNKTQKPGRNDPCYCGSGKKYKNCHMKIDSKPGTGRVA